MGADISAQPPNRGSLQVFTRSVQAFLLRELKQQFSRFQLGYVWALLEPAATVAVLVVIHAGLRGSGTPIYGVHAVLFFVYGAIPFFLFFNTLNRIQGVCSGSRGLFNYRQIKPIDVILARAIIEALSMLAVGFIFIGGWLLLGFPLAIDDPLGLAIAVFALFALGLSLGLLFEVFGTLNGDLRRVTGLILRPMFFISGVFFTIDMVPEAYRYAVLWNPILHAVDLARGAAIADYHSPASPVYLFNSIILLSFLGLASYRRHLSQLI